MNDEPITLNAVTCTICQSPAHRYSNRFQCSANPNHLGDLFVGIFSDLTMPTRLSAQEELEIIMLKQRDRME